MSLQFGRRLEVEVTKTKSTSSGLADAASALGVTQADTTKITDLDMTFSVTKTFKKEPNTCQLTIFNLNPDNRGSISSDSETTVEVSAGYGGDQDGLLGSIGFGGGQPVAFGLIYSGDIRNVYSTYATPDWTTILESGDGEKSKRKARVNRSFGPGTPLAVVMREAGLALGVGTGNLNLFALDPRNRLIESSPAFLHGVVLSGNAWKEFDRVVSGAGLEWSVQDGKIQIARYGEPLSDFSITVTPETGLIGSPTVSNKGIASFRTLLNPNTVPGRGITLESKEVNGKFLVKNVTYSGDNMGGDFYCDIEAAQLEEGAGGLLSVVSAAAGF